LQEGNNEQEGDIKSILKSPRRTKFLNREGLQDSRTLYSACMLSGREQGGCMMIKLEMLDIYELIQFPDKQWKPTT